MVMLITMVSLIGFSGIQQEGFSVASLGTNNIFTALFIALSCSALFFKIKDKRLFCDTAARHGGG